MSPRFSAESCLLVGVIKPMTSLSSWFEIALPLDFSSNGGIAFGSTMLLLNFRKKEEEKKINSACPKQLLLSVFQFLDVWTNVEDVADH